MYRQTDYKNPSFHSLIIASRPFGLRSKCSICSRRFESRRWLVKNGQALSNGFLDIDRDHPSILGPVSRIISTLQCRRDRSTPVFFGKREPIYIILNLYENFLFLLHHIVGRDREWLLYNQTIIFIRIRLRFLIVHFTQEKHMLMKQDVPYKAG